MPGLRRYWCGLADRGRPGLGWPLGTGRIVAALTIALVVGLFAGALAWLPDAVLGAILVSAAIDLFDGKAFVRLGRIDLAELVLALIATAGVIWIGVLNGVFIAVAATFVHLIRLATRPEDDVMGRNRHGDLVTLSRRPDAEQPDRILVYLFKASIMFVNAEYFRERVLEELARRPDVKWLVLDTSAMTYADSAAVEMMVSLKERLDHDGIVLLVGGGHGRFRQVAERSGMVDLIGRDRSFLTPAGALAAAEALRDAARAPPPADRNGVQERNSRFEIPAGGDPRRATLRDCPDVHARERGAGLSPTGTRHCRYDLRTAALVVRRDRPVRDPRLRRPRDQSGRTGIRAAGRAHRRVRQ